MNNTPIHLLPALRQYQHNDSTGFLMGYDYTEVNKVHKVLQDRIAELENENKELQECFDECYEELRLTRDAVELENHIQSLKAINEYIDEGCPDMQVVRSEIGEVISRAEGTYLKAVKEKGE